MKRIKSRKGVLNHRVTRRKEEILHWTQIGFKPHEIGRILELDSRTVKNALERWGATVLSA